MDIQQKMNAYNETLISTLWNHKIKVILFAVLTVFAYAKVPEIHDLRAHLEQKKNHDDKLLNASEVMERMDIFDKVLDVRSTEEYNKGHVKNSIHVEYKDIIHSDEREQWKKANIMKTDTLLIYCKTGRRASMVRNFLINELKYNPKNIYITNADHESIKESEL